MEAIAVLKKREVAAEAERDQMMVAANADAAVFLGLRRLVLGNPEGDITIVEFNGF